MTDMDDEQYLPPEDDPNDENLVQAYHDQNKRRGWIMIGGVVLVAMLLVALGTALFPPDPATNKMGVHLLLDDGRNQWDDSLWPAHFDRAAAVGRFVTQLVRADDLDTERWQTFMDLAAERELVPIIRLATVWDGDQGWWVPPPTDSDGGYTTIAQTYAEFLTALEWPTGPRYVVVGNEPNHGEEWGGVPDPAAYARFLIDVSRAVNAADPGFIVANAPLDFHAPHTNGQPFSNGMVYLDAESFMDAMILAEPDVFNHVEVWASHPYAMGAPWEGVYQIDYLNGASNPNAETPPDFMHNRGVNAYEWALYKLARLNVRRGFSVIITETGWNTEAVDPDTIADYYDLALRGNKGRYPDLPESGWNPWLDDARVQAVTPFALNGAPVEWDRFNWLTLDDAGNIDGTQPVYARAAKIYSE